MNGVHYLNGVWVEAGELKISAFDLALTRGLGVFDTLRTHNGRPFMLERHLERFQQAIDALSIQLSINQAEVRRVIEFGMKKNQLPEAVIRLNATTGVNEGRLSSSKPSFFVMFLPLSLPSQQHYRSGQSLKSVHIPRTLPQIKTINYVSAKLSLIEAGKAGADEALYIDRDENILETTISNIFFWQDDKLITPPAGEILLGITRELVIDLANQESIEVVERNINLDEVSNFSEAFACSSIKGIMPVTNIDGVKISESAGLNTKSLMKAYQQLTQAIGNTL